MIPVVVLQFLRQETAVPLQLARGTAIAPPILRPTRLQERSSAAQSWDAALNVAAHETCEPAMSRIAILHPTDPVGHVPGGIDSFIKGILKWAPDDLEYTLFGATSDPLKRPRGRAMSVTLGARTFDFVPIVPVLPSSARSRIPLTVRYMWELGRRLGSGQFAAFDVLDFHRIEPALLFRADARPKNIFLHTDRAAIRSPHSSVMWRHWPALYERLEARAFATTDRVFSVSRSAVESYSSVYSRFAQRFIYTPTWVDPETFHPIADARERNRLRAQLLETLNAPAGSRLLVFVGRLEREKNPAMLLEAFCMASATHESLHLIVIGDGSLRPEVDAMCRRKELRGRVSLLGVQRAQDIAGILQVSDLFVLSSDFEGMPIAVLEALATGVPVVSTDVGELSAIVQDGITGRLSKNKSSTALSNAIRTALNELSIIQGKPCVMAAARYHPAIILSQIYENHRRQCTVPDHLSGA